MIATKWGRLLLRCATLVTSLAMAGNAGATGLEGARAFRQGLRGNTRIAGGGAHSLAIATVGQVLAWGGNDFGQLGTGTRAPELKPAKVPDLLNAISVAAGESHSLALLGNGQIWAWGRNDEGQLGDGSGRDQWSPVWVSDIDCAKGVVAIAAGGWGDNSVGTLGIGSTGLARLRPVPNALLTIHEFLQ